MVRTPPALDDLGLVALGAALIASGLIAQAIAGALERRQRIRTRNTARPH